ncbi:MAG: aspartate--tRNA ligase [Acidimicrobiales bacterium]
MTAVGMRTDWCGELTTADEGREVVLCGWVATRREHGEHLAFVDVRDRTGVIQCVVPGADDLRSEYVVKVTGTVRHRPEGTTNPDLATGEVEVGDCRVEVLATADALPFPISDRIDADESLRLRHRYLDLRRSRLQANLGQRAEVNRALRNAMADQGFTEVETPMLIASTPEGARDFVVPSRLHPGEFYALPQSPQLFKQLCMVGGVERYFQVARCMRDEDLRADRQFEFTQLDLEASFVGEADVRTFTEVAVAAAVEAVTGDPPRTFGSITWHDAMERYGSDKPDTRFGLELVELTEVFAGTEFKAFQSACVKGIRVPGGAEKSRRELDGLVESAQALGAKGLVWMKVDSHSAVTSPVAKFLAETEIGAVIAALDGDRGDLLLLVADERRLVRHVLGALRLELGRPPVNEGGLHFLWVVDFPLFEALGEDGVPVSAHHPFTMPHPDDLALLDQGGDALLDVRAQAYDLTLNGWELGSGSVRIHSPDVQRRIFELLGIDEATADERFGFLLDAFRFGAPPHAGFAFGIDRLVALLVGEENIREVIAFPKTQSGADPLTGAPSAIADRHLAELGLRILPPKA